MSTAPVEGGNDSYVWDPTEPIGKRDLLEWAFSSSNLEGSVVRSVRKYTKLEELSDGVAFILIIKRMWPRIRAIPDKDVKSLCGGNKFRPQPKFQWEVKTNWDTLQVCLKELRLPSSIVDYSAIQQGKFKPLYNFAVMLFFLEHFAQDPNFCADFAHPIDPKLAAFLTSQRCIDCLGRGGGALWQIPVVKQRESLQNSDLIGQNVVDDILDPLIDIAHPGLQALHTSRSKQSNDPCDSSDTIKIYSDEHRSSSLSPSSRSTARLHSYEERWKNRTSDFRSQIKEVFSPGKESVENEENRISDLLISGRFAITAVSTNITTMKSRSTNENIAFDNDLSDEISFSKSKSSVDGRSIDVVWSSKDGAIRGSVLMSRLQYEIDSLERQLALSKSELTFLEQRHQRILSEITEAHMLEISSLHQQLKLSLSSREADLAEQKARDEIALASELERVASNIQLIGTCDKEKNEKGSSSESSRLRSLNIVYISQIESLTEALNETKSAIDSLKHITNKNAEVVSSSLLPGAFERDKRDLNDALEEQRVSFQGKIEELQRKLFKATSGNVLEIEGRDERVVHYVDDSELNLVKILKLEIENLKEANSYLRNRFDDFVNLFEKESPSLNEGLESVSRDSLSDVPGPANNLWVPSNNLIGGLKAINEVESFAEQLITFFDRLSSTGTSASVDTGRVTRSRAKRSSDFSSDQSDPSYIQSLRRSVLVIMANLTVFRKRIMQSRETIADHQLRYKLLFDRWKQDAERLNLLSNSVFSENLKSNNIRRESDVLNAHKVAKVEIQLLITANSRKAAELQCTSLMQEMEALKTIALSSEKTELRYQSLVKQFTECIEYLQKLKNRECMWQKVIENQTRVIELNEKVASCETYEELDAVNDERERLDAEILEYKLQIKDVISENCFVPIFSLYPSSSYTESLVPGQIRALFDVVEAQRNRLKDELAIANTKISSLLSEQCDLKAAIYSAESQILQGNSHLKVLQENHHVLLKKLEEEHQRFVSATLNKEHELQKTIATLESKLEEQFAAHATSLD